MRPYLIAMISDPSWRKGCACRRVSTPDRQKKVVCPAKDTLDNGRPEDRRAGKQLYASTFFLSDVTIARDALMVKGLTVSQVFREMISLGDNSKSGVSRLLRDLETKFVKLKEDVTLCASSPFLLSSMHCLQALLDSLGTRSEGVFRSVPSLALGPLRDWRIGRMGFFEFHVKLFFLLDFAGELRSNLKYHSTWWFNRAFESCDDTALLVPPVRGDSIIGFDGGLPVGPVRRFLSLYHSPSPRRYSGDVLSLFYSYQQSGRGRPQIGDREILQGMKKHRSIVSSEGHTSDAMLQEITRTAEEIFSKFPIPRALPATMPSLHASLENKVSLGGAYRTYVDRFFASGDPVPSLEDDPLTDGLLRWKKRPVHYKTDTIRLSLSVNGEKGSMMSGSEDDVIRVGLSERIGMMWPPTRVESANQVAGSFLLRDVDAGLPPYASVSAVLEPDKARLITVMPSDETTFGKPFQKYFHTILRNHPVFRLVGQPLGASVLQEFTNRADRLIDRCSYTKSSKLTPFGEELLDRRLDGGSTDVVLVSGDYDAATDNLSLTAITHCVRAICKAVNIDEVTESLLVRTVDAHYLTYPKVGGQEVPPVLVTRGTPMGSILSFIVLCVINAAQARRCLEQAWGKRLFLKECPLLINGDDILLAFPPQFSAEKALDNWVASSEEVGFVANRAKTLVSSEYAMLNKEIWKVQYIGPSWPVPFINLGLLYGIERSDDSATTGSFEQPLSLTFGSMANRLCRDFETLPAQSLFRLFLKCSEALLEPVKGLNWFIPLQLGGLGVDPRLADCEIEMTHAQRMLAARCACISDPEIHSKLLSGLALSTPLPPAATLALVEYTRLIRSLGQTRWSLPGDRPTSSGAGMLGALTLLHTFHPLVAENPAAVLPLAQGKGIRRAVRELLIGSVATKLHPMDPEKILSWDRFIVAPEPSFSSPPLQTSSSVLSWLNQ